MFEIHDNYALINPNNETIGVIYLDDVYMYIAKDWKIKCRFKPYMVEHNPVYNFSIVEGCIPREDLDSFKQFVGELDQAYSILRDDYTEIKTYFRLCIMEYNKRRKNNDSGGSIRDNSLG